MYRDNAFTTTRPRRICYVCGQATVRRRIADPLLPPTCFSQDCRERAAQLPVLHCSVRLANQRLCGAPAIELQVDAQWVCAWHTRVLPRRYPAA